MMFLGNIASINMCLQHNLLYAINIGILYYVTHIVIRLHYNRISDHCMEVVTAIPWQEK
ncbi:hypothetical protein TRIP_E220092 [uncultured Spirochaetota bacterium]|jgi:hypothetical protein|nr:hypothetical protein TRIP_E220092 [uncultured Spirochaetota bacterium]